LNEVGAEDNFKKSTKNSHHLQPVCAA
jgi:hypothetical protein